MRKPLLTKTGVLLLVIGGLILWNTWIVGFLNHGLAGYTGMSISELNVAGQPFSTFFTVTEWLSGLLLLIGSLVLLAATNKKSGFLLVALLLVAIIGILTMFDAHHPLDCNRFQDESCALKWARGEVTTEHKEHGIESEMTEYVTIVFAGELAVWAIYTRISKQELPWIELAIVCVIAVTIAGPFLISSDNITIESIGQRIWNTVTSVAFVYVAYKVWLSNGGSLPHYSQRKTRKAIA